MPTDEKNGCFIMVEHNVCENFMNFIKYMNKTMVTQVASCLVTELWGKNK